LRAPQDYADVFRILGEAGILPQDLTEPMQDMARFRNLLVHLYRTIDQERVFNNLPHRLTVLERFVQILASRLSQQQGG
jgi:uncharacterized protein YutE (UPF0331/DUF86 family)